MRAIGLTPHHPIEPLLGPVGRAARGERSIPRLQDLEVRRRFVRDEAVEPLVLPQIERQRGVLFDERFEQQPCAVKFHTQRRRTNSSGNASIVCPFPVVVVAFSNELMIASSVASIVARKSGDIASFAIGTQSRRQVVNAMA